MIGTPTTACTTATTPEVIEKQRVYYMRDGNFVVFTDVISVDEGGNGLSDDHRITYNNGSSGAIIVSGEWVRVDIKYP